MMSVLSNMLELLVLRFVDWNRLVHLACSCVDSSSNLMAFGFSLLNVSIKLVSGSIIIITVSNFSIKNFSSNIWKV